MSDCNNGLFNCITPLPMDASGKLSDYEFLCRVSEQLSNIYNKLPDKSTIDKINMMSTSYINAVLEGIDNTGQTTVGAKFNELITNNPGRYIYVPKGMYNLETTIIIPTNGVMLVCDPQAEFYTNITIPCLLQIGSGVTATNLTPFGVFGGTFNGNNVTSYCIYVGNHNYSGRIFNSYIYNVESVGIQMANTNITSTQTFISDVVIHGKTYTKGNIATGIITYGTDNYLNNINIGHCRKGIIFGGGGNIVENIHIWYGKDDFPDNPNNSDMMEYQAVRNNGNSRMTNVHIDNPFIAYYLTGNSLSLAVANTVINVDIEKTFYSEPFTPTLLYLSFPFSSLGSGYMFTNVYYIVRPAMTGFKTIRYTSFNTNSQQMQIKRQTLFDARMTYQSLLNLRKDDLQYDIINRGTCYAVANNNPTVNPNVYYQCMLIQANKGSAMLTFSDDNGGLAVVYYTNTSIQSLTADIKNNLNPYKTLYISNTAITIDNMSYYPVYIKYNTNTPDYNGLLVTCLSTSLAYILAVDYNTTETMSYVTTAPSGSSINLYNP